MPTIKFATNVPVELRLRAIEGRPVESQFGGQQHMFSCEEGAFYVSETVGQILTDQLRKLHVQVGDRVEICKAEVATGGRKRIQWTVAQIYPGEQPDGTFAIEKPSDLEQKLAASIAQVEQRKQAQQAQTAAPMQAWQVALLNQTKALTDVYAAALAHSSATHGNAVKPDDVRSFLVTTFINLTKAGSNRNAA